MITEELYTKFLHALIAGKRSDCSAIVQELLDADIKILELYGKLFKRCMYEVGDLWELNKITVANEHLATAIVESLMNLVYPALFQTARIQKKVVVGCCANELHQIGAKMVADSFELHGWDSHFLGANTPLDDMMNFIDDAAPDLVGLSLGILSNIEFLKNTLEAVNTDFPNMDLLVGGQAFRWGGVEMLHQYPNVQYVASLDELKNFI